MGGGAWPFLVRGVICLLNCDNERDLPLLNSPASPGWSPASQRDYRLKAVGSWRQKQVCDALRCPGQHARYTDGASEYTPLPKGLGNLVKLRRAGDRALQLLLFNEECLVSASHQLALITSLPFVHTARRYYRLNGLVRLSDWLREVGNDHPEPES